MAGVAISKKIGAVLSIRLHLVSKQPFRDSRNVPDRFHRDDPLAGEGLPRFHHRPLAEGNTLPLCHLHRCAYRTPGFQNDRVEWVLSDRRFRLELQAVQAGGGLIYGPTRQDMGKRVDETLDASVSVRLSERGGKVIFEGNGRHAGLEINGDTRRLLTG